jgi:tripartite-type tricarboxylate transporter receptor subunit TctC
VTNRAVVKSLVVSAVLAMAPAAHAQDASKFPEKPLRLIVPFAAGGPTDVMARLVAAKVSESIGQQVMV